MSPIKYPAGIAAFIFYNPGSKRAPDIYTVLVAKIEKYNDQVYSHFIYYAFEIEESYDSK